MQPNHFSKAIILALILVTGFVVFWELYWRNKGYSISFNDNKVTWTQERKKVYKPLDEATVFAGSSRIKFALDIVTWEKLTGEKAIQLAFVGTGPRLVLRNLASDENFRGKLVMDVTEHSFFSRDTLRTEKSAREGIQYYHSETPAQKVSTAVNYFLESKLVFLEEGKFGLNPLLNELPIPNRQGFFTRPRVPKYMSGATIDRQSVFTSIFLGDTALQNKQIAFWAKNGALNKSLPIKGDTLAAFFKELKTYIDRIRSRGGRVVFVRPPSAGSYLEREKRDYPREQYWDRLLEYTQTPGYHYSDYPEMAHLVCVEESHLTPGDAIKFTTQLANILKEKNAWDFQSTISENSKSK